MIRKSKTAFTFTVIPDSKPDKQGLSKIYFRLVVNGVKKDINIGVKWPVAFFDKARQEISPRYKGDPDVLAGNLKINEMKAIAHRLDVNAFVKKMPLTIKNILQEFDSVGSSEDFFQFYLAAAKHGKENKFFQEKTYYRHISTLRTFRNFLQGINILPICDIDLELIEKFNHYALTILKVKNNTVSGYHKDLKKYLGIAVKQGLIPESPYSNFKFKYVDGEREALTTEQLSSLFKLYNARAFEINGKLIPLSAEHYDILRRFLFSCMTGIRISDTHHLTTENVKNNVLVFQIAKGKYRSGKILKIPLSEVALSLIKDRQQVLFNPYSDQYINECLKYIAGWAGIPIRLTYHVARDTFATQYIIFGGDLKTLSELLGHSSIKITAIYVKMTLEIKLQHLNNFNRFLQ